MIRHSQEYTDLLTANDWVAETNIFGLWVIGPELEDGTLNVIGMGRTFQEACEMAVRTSGVKESK